MEDNATKALINVLDLADRKVVLKPFLARFCRVHARDVASVEFALQRPDIRQPQMPQRVALVIAPVAGWARAGAHRPDQGRPDAWIWEPGAFAVLIENKVKGQATRQQICRHIAGACGWTPSNSNTLCATWAQVHDFFRTLMQSASAWDPKTAFLVRQFEEYLRMTNLSASTVLELDDFAYFATPEKERHPDRKAAVERKFCDLARAIAAQPVMRQALGLYGGAAAARIPVNPGRFNRDRGDFWISIGPKKRRTNAHFTARIGQAGISIDCFAPHKAYTQRIVQAIRQHPDEFLAALRHVPERERFYIRLREAYYANPRSTYKGRNIGNVRDFLEVHPRELTRGNLDLLVCDPIEARRFKPRFRAELFLVRYFDLGEVVGAEGVAHMVAEAAEMMLPFLKFALHRAGDLK